MQLAVMNENQIAEADRAEINTQIDNIVERHKNNRYEINKLVFESVAALTESENYSNELSSQGAIKRFWGGITGKNAKLRNQIDNSLAAAQYASQRTLQKLAEQNLMSFELIAAVNNKLNASLVSVENEINTIYGTLVTFFKQTKSDIIQLENRVKRLERNVNLLNWQNSIEYQMWNSIEYAELDDISKIVCMVRDFYDITKGEWRTSDLLLLKVALATVGLSTKDLIKYSDFIYALHKNKDLKSHLFEGKNIEYVLEYSEVLILTSAIRKREMLDNEEHYLVRSVAHLLQKFGSIGEENLIKYELLKEHELCKKKFNLDAYVNAYDLALELIYNLCMLEEVTESEEEIDYEDDVENEEDYNNEKLSYGVKYDEAVEAIIQYDLKKAFSLLEELVNEGCGRAHYLLGEIFYKKGYGDVNTDDFQAKHLFKKGMELKDVLCKLNYAFLLEDDEEEKLISECIPVLEIESQQGDIQAKYEYAELILSGRVQGCSSMEGLHMLEEAANAGWWVAAKKCGLIYLNGKYGIKEDYGESWHWYMMAAELGDPGSMMNVARFYEGDRGMKQDLKTEAMWYIRAAELGYTEAYISAGILCYHIKDIDGCLWWLREAVRVGEKDAAQMIKDIFGPAYDSSCLRHDCKMSPPTIY